MSELGLAGPRVSLRDGMLRRTRSLVALMKQEGGSFHDHQSAAIVADQMS